MKYTRILGLWLCLSAGLIAAGCGQAARQSTGVAELPAPAHEASGNLERPQGVTADKAGMAAGLAAPGGGPSAALPSSRRLIVRTADLSLQATDVAKSEAAIRAKVDQLGGYVVQADNEGTAPNVVTRLTVRIPAAKFDEAINAIQAQATKVLRRNISGNDVTEEYVDLESRQKTLEATRDRLLAMLDKAEDVDQALKVNAALTDIQGQLDQTLGRKKFLSESASLSSITLQIYPDSVAAPIVEQDAWAPLAVAKEALRGLVGFGQWFINLLIVVLIWTPVWLSALLVVRWFQRRRRAAKAGAAIPPKPTEAESKP